METKGLVMKITDRFMVVMCDDGKFRNLPLPKQPPRVGERITVSLGKKKRFSYTWISSIAALFLIALASVLWVQLQPTYTRVVAIDINPSLELYVDSKGRVKDTWARNQDAATLLAQHPVKNLFMQDAIQQVIQQSVAEGYISQVKENLVMVAIADKKGIADIDTNSIKTLLKETLQDKHMSGFLKVEVAPESLYESSKTEGISLNKLILAQQAEQQGIKLDFKANPTESVLQVLEKAGVQKEQFLLPVSAQGSKENGNGKARDGKPMTNPGKPETEKGAIGPGQTNNLPEQVNQLRNQVPVPGIGTNAGASGGTSSAPGTNAGTDAGAKQGTSPVGSGNQNGSTTGGTSTKSEGTVSSGDAPQTTDSGKTGTGGGTGQTNPTKGTLPEEMDQDQKDDDLNKDDGAEEQDDQPK